MRRFAAVSTTFAAALVLVAAVAGPAIATNSWNGYHWARTSNPFTIKAGDNLSSAWKPYLQNTASDWSKSTVLDLNVVAGASNTKSKRCSATSGRVEVCSGSYGNNGWLGIAQIWLGSGHITQGTVRVNDSYFNLAKYNNSSEKEHVMCQEVGHTLGLDHQSTSGASLGTCMDYYQNTSSSDPKSTSPNQHDYDELGIIYQHLDSSTTIGQSTGSSPGNSHETVSSSRASDGSTVITFILWA